MDSTQYCYYCQQPFSTSQILNQHIESCRFKQFKCLNCNQQIAYHDYQTHICSIPNNSTEGNQLEKQLQQLAQSALSTVESVAHQGFNFFQAVANHTVQALTSVANEISQKTEEPRQNFREMIEGWEERARQAVRERQQNRELERVQEEFTDLRASTLPNFKYRTSTNLGEENRKCAICQIEFNESENINILPCLHRYHEECIRDWFRKKRACPICRTQY